MSIIKIILIVAGIGFILFILMLLYVLTPTIKNVSKEDILIPFIKKPLLLKKKGYLYKCEKGMYCLHEYILTEREDFYGTRVLELPTGSTISINEFKTYTNNGGSGFTYLYGLGEITLPTGQHVPYEYSIGTVEKGLYSNDQYLLHATLWQDSTDQQINLIKKK